MKEIFVERRNNILRIAIRNKGILKECIVEEENKGPLIGEIYKGRVKNIIPATNSIFVDIGLDKEATENAISRLMPLLNDYKLREIISNETKEIKTILYAKAFAEDENLKEEDIHE